MKKIIDILGIALPALIILLGLGRAFFNKKNSFNGLILFIAVILLLVGIIRFTFFRGSSSDDSGPAPEGLAVSKHSESFNSSLEYMLKSYYLMTEGFVNWDITTIQRTGNELKLALDSLKLDELKKDTTGIFESATEPLSNARAELESILKETSWEEKRASLNLLSDNLRLLLTIVKYDRSVVYWQECPMAFADDVPGNWMSKTEEVRNPYLGTKDPKYGDKMLDCGGTKAIIDFTPKDSTGTVK
jgi:hypothetical protein